MSEHTPTDDEVRGRYCDGRVHQARFLRVEPDMDEIGPAFDRWLEAHDQQVREKAAPRLITDPDELDALPVDSVVIDATGDTCQCVPASWTVSGTSWASIGSDLNFGANDILLPARVIWEGQS